MNPQSLRKDDQNNYIVECQIQILNTIGSYLKTIHECKETIPNNIVHQRVQSTFSRFPKLKTEYENNKTTFINFNKSISDNFDEDDWIDL